MQPLLASEDPSVHTERPSLEAKNVLVSGGTSGIGRAIASLLSAYGANVFVFGRHEPELRRALDDIGRRPGKVGGLAADQSRPEDLERVFATFDAEFGDLDILVNNAAVDAGSITEGDEADWRRRLEIDLFGYIDCTRRALSRMRARGGPGHIVNIGSMAAEHHNAGASLYVAAKSAIRGFSRALRKEVDGAIKVSLVEPGYVGTGLLAAEPEGDPETQRAEQARGAMLKPEDIAVAVHYILTQPARCAITQLQIEPALRE